MLFSIALYGFHVYSVKEPISNFLLRSLCTVLYLHILPEMIDILGFGYAALVATGGIIGYIKAGKHDSVPFSLKVMNRWQCT